MNIPDLITMIGNVAQDAFSVQKLISGFSYVLGIILFFIALLKLQKIGESKANSSSHERLFVPIAYLVAAAALLFLPSAIQTLTNTTFGRGTILQYGDFNKFDIRYSMGLIIKTVGVIWFVRGCVLLAQASEPGVQHGLKGLAFVCAGVFALNYDNTIAVLTWAMEKLTGTNFTFKVIKGE